MRSIPLREEKQSPHGAPLDDASMEQHIRLLAVRLNPDGKAALRFPSEKALHQPVIAARTLRRAQDDLPAGWLRENGQTAESLMLSMFSPNGPRLPACAGYARIQLFARELVLHSGALISRQRLISCLRGFIEVRELTMDELWSVPAALCAELAQAYLSASSDAASALPGQQSQNRQRLVHLLTTLNMLSALDWSEAFQSLCRADALLSSDPAGIYPGMDESSKSLVRRQVARIAKACRMSETAIAQCALKAAEEGEGIARSVCWWLYSDEGVDALLRKNRLSVRLRPLIPDPTGRKYLFCLFSLTLTLFLFVRVVCGSAAALTGLPILWGAAASFVHALIPRIRKPHPMLRLKLDAVPDEYRTLVVLPGLLSSPERAAALAEELEVLGCLEKDENISFLLLGDLPASKHPVCNEDEAILSAAKDRISRANARAEREKYLFLHRERSHQPCEGMFMGKERKRGALSALNRLLLTGENAFAEAEACHLTGRFPFVLTLDAGTHMLPGTARQLIGALAHPLNRIHRSPDGKQRGYALLAPRTELSAARVVSPFVRLYGGPGGADSYPTAVSDLYQDLCGQGLFGGKGIYDVSAFEASAASRLPDNLILSHDMAEGLLAGAGFLCDTAIYEGHPKTARSFFLRLNRWTRGDWQLIPLLFRGLPFSALDRYKILDNLRRSLEPAAQMLLLLAGFHSRSVPVVLLGLVPLLLPVLLHPLQLSRDGFLRLLLRTALLPHEVFFLLDGIARALWRMTVSRRHLLQWTTADDAERKCGALSPVPGWIASVLLLPALIAPAPWLLTDVLLAALWWTGASLAAEAEQPCDPVRPLLFEDRTLLLDLAARTLRFFTDSTGPTGLPPDNVQLDPPAGAAVRTSPTNIGLYLAACVSARELGLISIEELSARASETVSSLESMEKWNGHLYNWYHPETLEPLTPRYVSSVDSGNLAACLLLTARSLEREECRKLASRLETLAGRMDFVRLFDRRRMLFFVGMDAETGRMSASHYDLLASESRLLSFTAMMLGQIPPAHWGRLGRASVRTDTGPAPLSWSGTMFEYLMPSLFLPVYRGTLLDRAQSAVIAAQIEYPPRRSETAMPWGVSESGFYSFDEAGNYQYRAFGLPALALRSDASDGVIAPYASMLALPFAREEAIANLKRMISMGLMDDHGLYEAADITPGRVPDGEIRIVRSHMAHHQGMILCAVCNLLTDFMPVRLFMDRPQAKALRLLLEEKPVSGRAALRRLKESPPCLPCPEQTGLSEQDTELNLTTR